MIILDQRIRRGIGLVRHGKMYKSLEQIIREVAIWGEVSPGPDFAVLSEESEVKLQEGGHDDVSSMKTKVEIGLKAFEKMKRYQIR